MAEKNCLCNESGKKEWLFYGVAIFFLFFGLNSYGLWGSEDRWAEVSRNMLYYKDFFHPIINGTVYFDKPLISYWPIALVGAIIGEVNEFAVRFPSALFALLALWTVRSLARKLFNEECAKLAGWILLGCYGFIFHARLGAADIQNMTMILLAVAWFFRCEKTAGFFNYLLFYLILAVGAHMKGLPALIVPLALIFLYEIKNKRFIKHLKVVNFLAMFLGIGFFLLPYYLAANLALPEGVIYPGEQLSGFELMWRENITRAVNPFDHREPVYAYLIHVPRIVLPFSLVAIFGVIYFGINYFKELFKRADYFSSSKNNFCLFFQKFFAMKKADNWLFEAVVVIFFNFHCF